MADYIFWDTDEDDEFFLYDDDASHFKEPRMGIKIDPSRRTYVPHGYWMHKLTDYYQVSVDPLALMIPAFTIFEHMVSVANQLEIYERTGQLLKEVKTETMNTPSFGTLANIYTMAIRIATNAFHPGIREAKADHFSKFRLAATYSSHAVQLLEDVGICEISKIEPDYDGIYEFFGYTPDGRERFWWDPTGKIRDERGYTEAQINRFRIEPARTTAALKKEAILVRILELYDSLLLAMGKAAVRGMKWRNPRTRAYLNKLVQGVNPREISYTGTDPFPYLLRLCEHTVRDHLPKYTNISLSDEWHVLRYRFPKEIITAIAVHLDQYILPPFSKEEILANMDSGAGKHMAQEYLETHSKEEALLFLSDMEKEDAIKAIRRWKEKDLSFLFLQAVLERKISKVNRAKLEKVIHPSRMMEFLSIVESGMEGSFTEILDVFEHVQTRKIRKIQLNPEAVSRSRKELSETVAMVDQFVEIGEEEIEEEAEKDMPSIPSDRERAKKDILTKLLAKGHLTKEDMAAYSDFRLIMGEINDAAYDAIGAVLLFFEGEKLCFDPYDRDWIEQYGKEIS